MRKLVSTLQKDLTISFRSFYIYIEILMAVIIVAVLLFVVPENFQASQTLYVHVDADLPIDIQNLTGFSSNGEDAVTVLETATSRQALREALTEDRDALGVILSGSPQDLNLEFVMQGYESEAIRNLMEKMFLSAQFQLQPNAVDTTTITTLADPVEKLSDRVHILPILLVLNSAMIGLFVIASYIFMDKDDGTIRAFAVTPARLWQYLLSKVLLMLLTGLVTGLFTVLTITGGKVSVLPFIAILVACNLLGSVLGLLVASYFDTLTKSLGGLYILILIMGFSSVAYLMPGFSPLYLRVLPAYPMYYAFRQTLLSQPNFSYVYFWSAIFILVSFTGFFWSLFRFRKTLTV